MRRQHKDIHQGVIRSGIGDKSRAENRPGRLDILAHAGLHGIAALEVSHQQQAQVGTRST